MWCLLYFQPRIVLFADTAPQEQQDLFIKKLLQCCNIFNFMDPVREVKSKEIKRACLNELIEYVTAIRGVLTEPVYPEIIKMVGVTCTNANHTFEGQFQPNN